MRERLQQLFREVRDRNVFLVGGGKSFSEYVDINDLQNQVTIAINTAIEVLPDATAIYWVDESWASENYDLLQQHSCPLRFTSKHHAQVYIDKNVFGVCNSTVLRRTGDYGFDPDVDSVRGNNSGAQVLNLIANLRPKNIILLGYDMKVGHWHNRGKLPIKESIYSEQFVPSIASMAKEMEEKRPGISVINGSPISALGCFPFGEYRDFLEN